MPLADPRRLRPVLRTGGALLLGMLAPLLAALLLIPAGRVAAWGGLLIAAAGVAWLAGRDSGIVAAATAGLAFMWVHGPDRFAGRIADPELIRAGLLLGVLAVMAAVLADRAHHRSREEQLAQAVGPRRRRPE